MNPENFAEWLRRQGQRVLRTASSYWHSEGMGVFQAFPYHWLIEPCDRELRELASRHRALVLRYSTPSHMTSANIGPVRTVSAKVESAKIESAKIEPAELAAEAAGYHAVCTALDYGFASMGTKTRHHTRRSLRECTVGPISFDRYAEEGWQLRVDTLARQERCLHESRVDWKRRCLAAADLKGFEVWASQVDGCLAATLLTFQMQDWYYLVYQQCHRSYLNKHVNNALTFLVTTALLQRPHVRGTFYGMRSLDAPASVDEFKFHMGYERRPVRQRLVFHPALVPLVNPFSHGLLKLARKFSPRQRWLAKAEAMVRLSIMEKSANTPVLNMGCERVPESE